MRGIPVLACLALFAAPEGRAQEEGELVRKVRETVHTSFVSIEITLRKKTRIEKAEFDAETADEDTRKVFTMSENRQVLDAWGVAVGKDAVLMADRGVKAADVEKITVTDAAGDGGTAAIESVGLDHDFVLLRRKEGRDLEPISFSDWARPALGDRFFVTHAEQVDNRWHLNVSPYIQTNAPLREDKDWYCIDPMRPGAVLSGGGGETVGIALDQYLWLRADGRSSFLGKAILADAKLGDLEGKYESIRKELAGGIARVELNFRVEKGTYGSIDDRFARATVFGAALDDRGTIFIPEDLPRDMIRKIEDIRIKEGEEHFSAVFVGAFKGFSGMLIRAEGWKGKPLIRRDAAPPPPGRLFFTATLEDRFGRSRTRVDYNRLFRADKGLNGAARAQTRRRAKNGSFIVDLDGRILGCITTDRREDDLDELAMGGGGYREHFRYDRYDVERPRDFLQRVLFFSEIPDVLSNPAAHFDAKATPLSKKEEKKLVWLGAEYQSLTKPVAEALGVQDHDLTNDGRRGLILTNFYPGSPAERAGFREDDILLSLQPEGEAATRDLVGFEPDRYGRYRYDREHAGGMWRPARNYLTSLLTEIGAGKSVRFEYLRGKKKASLTMKLEDAPPDFESAEKYKHEALGLTVKELTYEVRYINKMEPGVSGVVVSKVESGSKAEVAKLFVHTIVLRVNDVEVRDLAHFRSLLSAPRGMTLTTLFHGQTRLVELGSE